MRCEPTESITPTGSPARKKQVAGVSCQRPVRLEARPQFPSPAGQHIALRPHSTHPGGGQGTGLQLQQGCVWAEGFRRSPHGSYVEPLGTDALGHEVTRFHVQDIQGAGVCLHQDSHGEPVLDFAMKVTCHFITEVWVRLAHSHPVSCVGVTSYMWSAMSLVLLVPEG